MHHLHFCDGGLVFLSPFSSEGAGSVHLLLAGSVPQETVGFCCDSDVLFMATTLVETNRQTDPALEVFPLCPSKGFLECFPQVGFQHVNERRMHGSPQSSPQLSFLHRLLDQMLSWLI